MTKAERAQWSALKTDPEAEQFVNQFLASRGPGFADDVAKRTAVADKYLTIGPTPGSRTLRGKIIVLLGPPSNFNVANREIEGERTSGATAMGDPGGARGGGGGQGASVSDMAAAAQRQGMGGKSVRQYSIKYDAKKLPPSFDKDLAVIIDADPATGKDHLADQKQMAELERVFEMVATARLTAK